jgi:hypothetical protein
VNVFAPEVFKLQACLDRRRREKVIAKCNQEMSPDSTPSLWSRNQRSREHPQCPGCRHDGNWHCDVGPSSRNDLQSREEAFLSASLDADAEVETHDEPAPSDAGDLAIGHVDSLESSLNTTPDSTDASPANPEDVTVPASVAGDTQSDTGSVCSKISLDALNKALEDVLSSLTGQDDKAQPPADHAEFPPSNPEDLAEGTQAATRPAWLKRLLDTLHENQDSVGSERLKQVLYLLRIPQTGTRSERIKELFAILHGANPPPVLINENVISCPKPCGPRRNRFSPSMFGDDDEVDDGRPKLFISKESQITNKWDVELPPPMSIGSMPPLLDFDGVGDTVTIPRTRVSLNTLTIREVVFDGRVQGITIQFTEEVSARLRRSMFRRKREVKISKRSSKVPPTEPTLPKSRVSRICEQVNKFVSGDPSPAFVRTAVGPPFYLEGKSSDITVQFPETLMSAEDCYENHGCITIRNRVAEEMINNAMLYIPHDHPILRSANMEGPLFNSTISYKDKMRLDAMVLQQCRWFMVTRELRGVSVVDDQKTMVANFARRYATGTHAALLRGFDEALNEHMSSAAAFRALGRILGQKMTTHMESAWHFMNCCEWNDFYSGSKSCTVLSIEWNKMFHFLVLALQELRAQEDKEEKERILHLHEDQVKYLASIFVGQNSQSNVIRAMELVEEGIFDQIDGSIPTLEYRINNGDHPRPLGIKAGKAKAIDEENSFVPISATAFWERSEGSRRFIDALKAHSTKCDDTSSVDGAVTESFVEDLKNNEGSTNIVFADNNFIKDILNPLAEYDNWDISWKCANTYDLQEFEGDQDDVQTTAQAEDGANPLSPRLAAATTPAISDPSATLPDHIEEAELVIEGSQSNVSSILTQEASEAGFSSTRPEPGSPQVEETPPVSPVPSLTHSPDVPRTAGDIASGNTTTADQKPEEATTSKSKETNGEFTTDTRTPDSKRSSLFLPKNFPSVGKLFNKKNKNKSKSKSRGTLDSKGSQIGSNAHDISQPMAPPATPVLPPETNHIVENAAIPPANLDDANTPTEPNTPTGTVCPIRPSLKPSDPQDSGYQSGESIKASEDELARDALLTGGSPLGPTRDGELAAGASVQGTQIQVIPIGH